MASLSSAADNPRTDDYPICEHNNCVQPAEEYVCSICSEGDEPLIEWLCDKHAEEGGYCLCCRQFSAGMDNYDFSPIKGFCGECVEMLRDEMGEYDDDYDEDYY